MGILSEESKELYSILIDRGYEPEFCQLISGELNTTWTANRMLGYLRYLPNLRPEDIVDEMLCILSDRDQIRKKKEAEYAQSKVNEIYNCGLGVEE